MIFFRCNVPVDILCPLPFEILSDKTFEIHSEIIPDKLKSGVIIPDHQVCIFADDMDLLDLLLIILAERPVILRFISDLVIKN